MELELAVDMTLNVQLVNLKNFFEKPLKHNLKQVAVITALMKF